jgi:hypothetical protein
MGSDGLPVPKLRYTALGAMLCRNLSIGDHPTLDGWSLYIKIRKPSLSGTQPCYSPCCVHASPSKSKIAIS